MSTTVEEPTYRTGKICYIEIPATDIQQSAEFYRRAFGWQTRQRGDGSTAFDDTVNAVSGTWVLGRPVAADPGLMVYIMVASAAKAVEAVMAAGGEIVHQVDPSAREVVATFRDPAGNLIGIYQQPGLAEAEARESSAALQRSSN
jgi:predicted enzyme related to lactoylglutathione lyase